MSDKEPKTVASVDVAENGSGGGTVTVVASDGSIGTSIYGPGFLDNSRSIAIEKATWWAIN